MIHATSQNVKALYATIRCIKTLEDFSLKDHYFHYLRDKTYTRNKRTTQLMNATLFQQDPLK